MKTWTKYCINTLHRKQNPDFLNWRIVEGFWQWLKDNNYQGIALTNRAQYETRYNTFLYGWDCESLVIFNPKNVKLSYK
jgi:hypothetical protein